MMMAMMTFSRADALAVLARRLQVLLQLREVTLGGAQVTGAEGLAQISQVGLDLALLCTCRRSRGTLASRLVGL